MTDEFILRPIVASDVELDYAAVMESKEYLPGGHLARNAPDPVPVILLGRLAIDTAFQGLGLGSALLKDALVRTITAAEAVGARALIVHTINDEVAQFYLRFGFRPIPAKSPHAFPAA